MDQRFDVIGIEGERAVELVEPLLGLSGERVGETEQVMGVGKGAGAGSGPGLPAGPRGDSRFRDLRRSRPRS